ncbi:MAG: hypothetical protein ACLQNG_05630 [Acidimicrobiales bacterium]|jgi:hypothetical protein
MLERPSWLLQNQINPFPVSGVLSLDDNGRLRFTLDAGAASCMLGWLEKALDTQGMKERVNNGERPVVFDLPVAQQQITWPKSLGGYGLKVDDGSRTWIITLDYPSGGGISQLSHIFKSKGTSKPWKDALAAAGAR